MAKANSTKRGPRFIDLTGQTLGHWHVIRFHSVSKGGKRTLFLCRCKCGKEQLVQSNDLRSGHSRSCLLCARRAQRTHGKSKIPEYRVWINMQRRCRVTKIPLYSSHAGRGIAVCERWSNFENFFEDMGPRPSPKHSIERIDNDDDYCPENCRWATKTEQSRNTRRNRLLTHDGKTLCLTEWAEILWVKPYTLRNRLASGWSVERTFTTPVQHQKRRVH